MAINISPGTTTTILSSIFTTTTAFALAIATAAPSPPLVDTPDDFPPPPPPPPFYDFMSDGDDDPHGPPPPNGECKLLGPFALIVQGALGVLALSALVFKRWRERPQRPLKIWAFDVSKQVVGSILVHVANLVMSMLSSGQFNVSAETAAALVSDNGVVGRGMNILLGRQEEHGYQPNPCSFYLLNLAIDTTVGIPILIILLRLLTVAFTLTPMGNPPSSLQSGHYGSPPKYTWWAKQCVIYFIGLLGMKLVVLFIFLLLPWISRIGDWALRWTEGNERLQVFFVMMFFPLIMNATQYYIIDTFIKAKKTSDDGSGEHARLAQEDDDFDDSVNAEDTFGSETSDSEAEDEEVAVKGRHKEPIEVTTKAVRHSRQLSNDRQSYDEHLDGESSPTTVVGSGSSTMDKDKLLSVTGRDSDDEAGRKR